MKANQSIHAKPEQSITETDRTKNQIESLLIPIYSATAILGCDRARINELIAERRLTEYRGCFGADELFPLVIETMREHRQRVTN